jgi:endoglucanase
MEYHAFAQTSACRPLIPAWRRAAIGVASCVMLAACSEAGSAPGGDPVTSQAYFPVQRCINLANALNAPMEGDWGYRIEEDHLRIIAEAGFDTVRVLIDWHSHAETQAPYTVDPAYFARIDEVIAQSFAHGLNVMIDMHNYEALYLDPEAHRERAIAIYRQIAEHYADYPPELIIELVNEPREGLSDIVWEAMAAELVRTIRESNPTRTLIVGGDNWSSLYGLQRLNLPDDPNLVATFHYYEPYDFTHQGADWFDDPPPVGLRWGSPQDRATLRAHLDEAGQWAEENNTPVLLGEFGAFRAADSESRAAWTQAMRDGAEANAMGWCYFDFAAGFEAWDPATQRWVPEIAEALQIVNAPPQLRR